MQCASDLQRIWYLRIGYVLDYALSLRQNPSASKRKSDLPIDQKLLNPLSLHANDRRVEEANKAVEARAVAKAAVEVEEVKAAALDQAVRITSAKALDTAIRTPDQLNLTLNLIPHPLTPTNCTLTVTDMEVAAGAVVEVAVEVDAAAAVAVAVGAILDPAISDILPVPDRGVAQHLFLVRRHPMNR